MGSTRTAPSDGVPAWAQRAQASQEAAQRARRHLTAATARRAAAIARGVVALGDGPPAHRGGRQRVAELLGISSARVGRIVEGIEIPLTAHDGHDWITCLYWAEEEQEGASRQLSRAAAQRARWIWEGVRELGGPPPRYLGGIQAVSRILGITPITVRNIIKPFREEEKDNGTCKSDGDVSPPGNVA